MQDGRVKDVLVELAMQCGQAYTTADVINETREALKDCASTGFLYTDDLQMQLDLPPHMVLLLDLRDTVKLLIVLEKIAQRAATRYFEPPLEHRARLVFGLSS